MYAVRRRAFRFFSSFQTRATTQVLRYTTFWRKCFLNDRAPAPNPKKVKMHTDCYHYLFIFAIGFISLYILSIYIYFFWR